jgi:hypothetical protein
VKCDGDISVRSLNFFPQRENAAFQVVDRAEVYEGKKPGIIIIFKDTNLRWHLLPQSHLVRKGLRPRKGATELFAVAELKKSFAKNPVVQR